MACRVPTERFLSVVSGERISAAMRTGLAEVRITAPDAWMKVPAPAQGTKRLPDDRTLVLRPVPTFRSGPVGFSGQMMRSVRLEGRHRSSTALEADVVIAAFAASQA